MEKKARQFRFSENDTYGPFLKTCGWMHNDLLISELETSFGIDKPSFNLVMINYIFENKGQKLALHIVTGLMLSGVFSRDLF